MPGQFSDQLDKIKDQYAVVTLGANPMLERFLDFAVTANIGRGRCAKRDITNEGTDEKAKQCYNENWLAEHMQARLESIYTRLLVAGNTVMVPGYYDICPWSFGFWQDTSVGNPDPKLSTWGTKCSAGQAKQAKTLLDQTNTNIQDAVATVKKVNPTLANRIIYIPPNPAWKDHMFGSADPWVISNDTGIHPNKNGHRALANTLMAGACAQLGLWCSGTQPDQPFPDCTKGAAIASESRRSANITIRNDTGQVLACTATKLDSGQWAPGPPETILQRTEGEFRTQSTGGGDAGSVTYRIIGDLSATVTFKWNNPYSGLNGFSCVASAGYTCTTPPVSNDNRISGPKATFTLTKS